MICFSMQIHAVSKPLLDFEKQSAWSSTNIFVKAGRRPKQQVITEKSMNLLRLRLFKEQLEALN